ncbi:MAG TPA: hypothetical protein VFN83_09480 [Gemmatimonadales bacterium]|nr:hypothetical protein [Gemmatimonadales bacterium]
MLDRPGAEDALLGLVNAAARGPRRDGAFALWLVARVTLDLRLDPPFPERLVRRRVGALERRLASLAVPVPLRRALAASVAALREPASAVPAVVLAQLVAPTRESVSPAAAEIVSELARAAR